MAITNLKLPNWPDGQSALERACYLSASRLKAQHQVADFCAAPLAGFYAAVGMVGFLTWHILFSAENCGA